MADITVTRTIKATPEAIFALVSDLPRMGEWSPENTGGAWQKGATGPVVGAQFKGNNRHGDKSWSTTVRVSECVPGKEFGFRVTVPPVKVAHWHYRITDNGDGSCIVTESWTDQRPGLIKKLGAKMSGVADREAHNRTGMETTLAKIDSALAAG